MSYVWQDENQRVEKKIIPQDAQSQFSQTNEGLKTLIII